MRSPGIQPSRHPLSSYESRREPPSRLGMVPRLLATARLRFASSTRFQLGIVVALCFPHIRCDWNRFPIGTSKAAEVADRRRVYDCGGNQVLSWDPWQLLVGVQIPYQRGERNDGELQ